MQNDFSKLTILYVEDEQQIRKNALEYLGRICKVVYEAKDGIEALKVYKEKQPDIIISDINMPRLNGLDMVKKIRQSDKTTPVILATAYTDTSYLIRAVELQLIKYLVKPITALKLKEALSLAYNHLSCGNITQLDQNTLYDTLNKILIINDKPIKLTKNELLLLDTLVKNHKRAVTYSEIENLIWLDDGMSMDSLRSLVRTLRKKLDGDFIENVSGVGYSIKINLSPS